MHVVQRRYVRKYRLSDSDYDDHDDHEEEEEDDGECPRFLTPLKRDWTGVPQMLLEDIFTLLTPKYRHVASQVCYTWRSTFYSPRVWETFTLLERTLTRRIFNLYKGYQRDLCCRKTQVCLLKVGAHFKKIIITPIDNFFSLYEFLRVLNCFFEFYEEFPMPKLHTFLFTFSCESRGIAGVRIHGTGGKILDILKLTLRNIRTLKSLRLNQLLLDECEVPGLIESMIGSCQETMRTLELLNLSKVPVPLPELARFSNLFRLTVSPQHLDEEMLLLLGGMGLVYLHILQDPYTCDCEAVSFEAWKLLKEIAPQLRVILEIQGLTKKDLLFQPRAPVVEVRFSTPYSKMTADIASTVVEHYSKTLELLVQKHLPRIQGRRSFHDRGDSHFLFIVQHCHRLHSLVIRERLSNASLILLANRSKNLKSLVVRQNALLKKCDWPKSPDWSTEFHRHLKKTARSYGDSKIEVAKVMGHLWRPLRDDEFMRLYSR
ncbi:uncharacterized protein LOC124117950 [Haliotis rufescens]|uniref:uncharacterized protein LOC124117950 n=1 Tax=Haliotis rufescens TaxID=6454 RepID=UPI001EB00D49|nr:uncharacterized protein LOC124117950 [Haliotis rufescens]XP_048255780.1 uncharacterized protein LOC124117950 [Haliotis rufescens]